ncbi:MAG: hypothetical protein J6I52_00820 [Prevotella sp.]|nr:hypothetical protein [Prevotella sp.]
MPYIDILIELASLHILKGADFIHQLKRLTQLNIFKPVEGEKDIYMAEGSHREDIHLLIDAARKAVLQGNKVYILPNPKEIRTADFIFENKGVYKMYDLKTIHGKSSVINRLTESIGQTNHVLLNMTTDYNARLLAKNIITYFTINPLALEVMIFKGTKSIIVKRSAALDKDFVKKFMFIYYK